MTDANELIAILFIDFLSKIDKDDETLSKAIETIETKMPIKNSSLMKALFTGYFTGFCKGFEAASVLYK